MSTLAMSTTSTAAQRRALGGAALVVLVCAMFAGMDTVIRLTGQSLPVLLTLLVRYIFQALAMALVVLPSRTLSVKSAHPRFQLLRGGLLLGCSALCFLGLKHMPVAEFSAISLLAPVLVVVLAALLLKERVTWLRWALVAGAWVGALIIIRPGSGVFGWAVVFPLAAVFFYAGFQLVSSRLAHAENPFTTQLWTGVIGVVLLAPLVLANLGVVWPAARDASAVQWAQMLLIGALGTFGHVLFLQAFRLAPASAVAPLTYSQLAWATLWGWLVFGQLPDAWSWLGMAVVVLCGATTAWLNVRGSKATAEAAKEPVE